MAFSFNDIEFAFLIALAVFLFFGGLKKRENVISGQYSGIDLPMSAALKGISCVLILMGHYVTFRSRVTDVTLFSKIIQSTTATIALSFFMIFSGYGLSVKRTNGGGSILTWLKRLKKVYIPLFLTCLVTLIIYALLPEKFSLEESATWSVSKDIWYLHHFNISYLGTLIPHLFGWRDWYVFCIMIFYTLFYLSEYLTRDNNTNQTWVLWLFFVIYFIWAYFYFGKAEAHWYRYCWAFFLGHVWGKSVKNGVNNKMDLLLLVLLSTTVLFENVFLIIDYFIAVVLLRICSRLNKHYTMNSRSLAFMGSISYFFYLSHIKIGGVLMAYAQLYSVAFWIGITILVSFFLLKTYSMAFK